MFELADTLFKKHVIGWGHAPRKLLLNFVVFIHYVYVFGSQRGFPRV